MNTGTAVGKWTHRQARAGLLAALALVCGGLRAEEAVAPSRIVAAGLFKNGLAVIRREVQLPGPGVFRLDDVPQPIHGTWWVASEVPIETRTTMREVDAPLRLGASPNLQEALIGRKVTVFLRDGQIPPATGTVEALADPKGEDAWNRTYQQPDYSARYGSWTTQPPPGRFLVLKSDAGSGRVFLDPTQIAYLKTEGAGDNVRQRRPVLLLTAPAGAKAGTVTITYLARGLAWAPSYQVDVSDPKTLSVTQNALVKNELADLQDAELELISGYPNIQFAHVTSPLALRTDWASFFQQLNQRVQSGTAATSNAVRQQAVMFNRNDDTGADLSAVPTGEGVDLHYQAIGKRTLKEGDALSLTIASGKAPYERIVEWIVPDTRDEYGRAVEEWRRQQDPDRYQDAAWDAVRFKNPLGFPMTTAPASILAQERFNGQTLSYWVNAGEENTLRVTHALSLRTRAVEKEEEGPRDLVWIGGQQYQKMTVKGELTVNNHRKEDVALVIRRRFSGELLGADGEPKTFLREEGVVSVNPRREMTWTFTLKPGEEKLLTYRYTVMVRR